MLIVMVQNAAMLLLNYSVIPSTIYSRLRPSFRVLNYGTANSLNTNRQFSRDVDPRRDSSIVDATVQNVSIITCNPDTIRSNHYHFEDFHYMYVVEGEIDYFFCDVEVMN